MAYSFISTKISKYLADELHYSDEQKIVLAFAVEGIILTISAFAAIMVLGFIIGAPWETFFAAVSGGLLRKFSGGAHCSTPLRCVITGAVLYSGIGLITKVLYSYGGQNIYSLLGVLIFGGFCLALILLYAPVDSPAKPIISPSFRKKLRLGSILTVLVFIVINLMTYRTSIGFSITGGLFIQSLTLMPILNRKEVQ